AAEAAERTALADDAVLVRRAPGALITERAVRALIAAAHSAPAAPVWLAPDGSIASAGLLTHEGAPYRALASHPREDAQALGEVLPVTALDAPVQASRAAAGGAPRTLLAEAVLGPAPSGVPRLSHRAGDTPDAAAPSPRGLRADGWSGGAAPSPRYTRSPERFVLPDGSEVPRLRWAIKTAAPAGPRGESWGETHFARALAGALERHGQYVAVDARPALDRASSGLDDVVLALRGPHPLPAPSSAHTILWIISHPDEITSAEAAGYDHVYAASTSWAATATQRFGLPVLPLLQCTDAQRFAPSGLPRSADLVFVGTARGIARPSVVEPLRAGRPVRVYGPDWRGYIPGSAIAGTHVDNDALPALYESAGAVLNDHWPAMRREGFVSNRLFDVVAAGGRAISDDVDGIADLFGAAVRTYDQIPELLALTSAPLDAKFCSDAELAEISRRIRAEHSFDARARTLLDDVLTRG
ncbi:glycosyltransferase, partial [Microbacterium sp. 13-71-7]|uniref:glycosyltransferase family protein n=1 Tax=Microbacterium sp. 13-71-7 TaxID=1970399 RepID=UPI000BC50865